MNFDTNENDRHCLRGIEEDPLLIIDIVIENRYRNRKSFELRHLYMEIQKKSISNISKIGNF